MPTVDERIKKGDILDNVHSIEQEIEILRRRERKIEDIEDKAYLLTDDEV